MNKYRSNIYNFNNIKFKSRLEVSCYKLLIEAGLNPSYESEKIILWEGFKPSKISYYSPKKIKRGYFTSLMQKQERVLLSITYTPDFIVKKDNFIIYFDVKGLPNDTYPIKKKMFLKYLENKEDEFNYVFFEPHNIGQIKQCIQIINNL